MREAAFLLFAGVALAGAAFVSSGALDNVQPHEGANTKLADAPTVGSVVADTGPGDSFAAWAAGVTELPRATDGHFYTDADVGGTRVRFLVDTGATTVALTGADARAAGLYWSDADLQPVAQDASGPVEGVAVVLDRVSVGGHEAREVRAIIVPQGLHVSLLGQSFLSGVGKVRIEQDRMILGE